MSEKVITPPINNEPIEMTLEQAINNVTVGLSRLSGPTLGECQIIVASWQKVSEAAIRSEVLAEEALKKIVSIPIEIKKTNIKKKK